MNTVDATPAVAARAEPIVAFRGVSLGYGATVVLRDVTFEVRAGELWFLRPTSSPKKNTAGLCSRL